MRRDLARRRPQPINLIFKDKLKLQGRCDMSTILIIVLLVLLLGGGGYYGHSMYGGGGPGGGFCLGLTIAGCGRAASADVSARILVLSSGDQWRRCFPLAKTSTHIDPLTSSLDQGHILRQSRESNKAVLTKRTRFGGISSDCFASV